MGNDTSDAAITLAICLLIFCLHFSVNIPYPAFALNNWNYMACYGADTRGNPVSLTVYSDSPIVTINGDRLLIVGKTVNGQGLVTENFISVNGMAVYDSIVPYSYTNLNIF